jgi:hypothetical protein
MTILVIILHNSTLYNNGRNRERGQYLTCISTCIEMNDCRQNFYNVNTLYDVFTNVAGDTILKILKEIYLYSKI